MSTSTLILQELWCVYVLVQTHCSGQLWSTECTLAKFTGYKKKENKTFRFVNSFDRDGAPMFCELKAKEKREKSFSTE